MSVTTIGCTMPVARTSHVCDLCRRTIRPGEKYERQACVLDGRAYTYRTCVHCEAFVRLCDPHSWVDDYGLDRDDVASMEPRSWTEARWLVQWRKQWTRDDGSLYPVPGGAS